MLLRDSVALRKESVDRNIWVDKTQSPPSMSLSARRAWIEILKIGLMPVLSLVALRKESVDRNIHQSLNLPSRPSRSPQGERG